MGKARVGRTLLSDAFDFDSDLDVDLDVDFDFDVGPAFDLGPYQGTTSDVPISGGLSAGLKPPSPCHHPCRHV